MTKKVFEWTSGGLFIVAYVALIGLLRSESGTTFSAMILFLVWVGLFSILWLIQYLDVRRLANLTGLAFEEMAEALFVLGWTNREEIKRDPQGFVKARKDYLARL